MNDKALKKRGKEHLDQIKRGIARKCPFCGWMMFLKEEYLECEMCDNQGSYLKIDRQRCIVKHGAFF